MTTHTDEELIAIAKAATPGEWFSTESPSCFSVKADAARTHKGDGLIASFAKPETETRRPAENSRFAATFSPAFVLSLIERAQAAEARARTAETERDEWKSQFDTSERVIAELTNDLAVANITIEKERERARTAEEALRVEKCEHAETQAFHDEQRRQLTLCQAERDAALSGQPAAPSLPAEVAELVKGWAKEAREEIDAHNEWLIEHHDEPDPGMDWIEVWPNDLLKLEAALAPFADRVAGKPVKVLVDQDWLARHVATDPDSSVEAGAVRNTERLPARDLTDAELIVEQTRVEKLWNSLHEPDEDGEISGRGGSPGEWMVERMDEIATEQARRGVPAVAEQTFSPEAKRQAWSLVEKAVAEQTGGKG